MIEVTVRDTETGSEETQTIANDYVLVVAGSCHVEHTQVYGSGSTHVLTIKGRRA